jgi:hypothetical protein
MKVRVGDNRDVEARMNRQQGERETRRRILLVVLVAVALIRFPDSHVSAEDNVVWTNIVNVVASGNTLTCTSSDELGGAVSTLSINSGDGYMEFTVSGVDGNRAAGLSHGDQNQELGDIDFAIRLNGGGSAEIWEGGVYQFETTYANGANQPDVFRVAVVGGVVKYSKNGSVFYTSTGTPTYPLLVDTFLATLNTSIANAVISGGSGGPPAAGWLNKPAGFTTETNQPWNSLASLGWGHANRGASSFISSDPTAPLLSPPDDPGNVLTHSYPVGFPAGTEPAVDFYPIPAGTTEGYVGYWWKVSNPWQGHPSNVNKMVFLMGNTSNLIFMAMYGPPGGPYELRLSANAAGAIWLTPNVNNPAVTVGQWHKIELYYKQVGTTLTARWWMDNTELGNWTNVPFSSAALTELQIAPTWGGIGGTKTQQDYFWFDHIIFARP